MEQNECVAVGLCFCVALFSSLCSMPSSWPLELWCSEHTVGVSGQTEAVPGAAGRGEAEPAGGAQEAAQGGETHHLLQGEGGGGAKAPGRAAA